MQLGREEIREVLLEYLALPDQLDQREQRQIQARPVHLVQMEVRVQLEQLE